VVSVVWCIRIHKTIYVNPRLSEMINSLIPSVLLLFSDFRSFLHSFVRYLFTSSCVHELIDFTRTRDYIGSQLATWQEMRVTRAQ